MPTQITENYLKTLFILLHEGMDLTITNISKRLEVTLPTANSMIKKLQEKGWVEYKKYKPVRFTEKGQRVAALIVRKHRLTEMYLLDKMGFGWEEVHEIAEQIEHIKSTKLFDRMDELLGFPTIDPHGSPIPDKSGNLDRKTYYLLSDMEAGDKVILKALKDSSSEFLIYLNKNSLSLGTEIEIVDKEEFDGSMILNYASQKSIGLSSKICERLLVERI